MDVFLRSETWLSGPAYLLHPERDWPVSPDCLGKLQPSDPEVKLILDDGKMAGKSVKTRNTIQTQLRPSPQATTTASSDPPTPAESVPSQAGLDVAALKFELLASLRAEIADIFKKELQATLGDALSTIQLDLQTVKAQLAKDKADTDANVASLKGTVVEMENVLSECTRHRSDEKRHRAPHCYRSQAGR
ncbi:hypothetical protein D5F01_LYC12196 [Larimichthys crocea]|uniref:Uncharacterized protein n=1 Tax=Larimichthys crocea TaxID=215358 RepID=A0A6G0IA68_LARCR|nr:hypothetical protein D5F01_LYC12196 [Larimichthys crocea]